MIRRHNRQTGRDEIIYAPGDRVRVSCHLSDDGDHPAGTVLYPPSYERKIVKHVGPEKPILTGSGRVWSGQSIEEAINGVFYKVRLDCGETIEVEQAAIVKQADVTDEDGSVRYGVLEYVEPF